MIHGSNIKNPPNETKNIIVISDGEMDPKKDLNTTQKITQSQENNMINGNKKKQYSKPLISGISDPSLELELINPQDLPNELISSIGAALGAAHFAIWIPNTLTNLVTIQNIIELPPGSAIILIFNDTHPGDLPDKFEPGKSYLIPT